MPACPASEQVMDRCVVAGGGKACDEKVGCNQASEHRRRCPTASWLDATPAAGRRSESLPGAAAHPSTAARRTEASPTAAVGAAGPAGAACCSRGCWQPGSCRVGAALLWADRRPQRRARAVRGSRRAAGPASPCSAQPCSWCTVYRIGSCLTQRADQARLAGSCQPAVEACRTLFSPLRPAPSPPPYHPPRPCPPAALLLHAAPCPCLCYVAAAAAPSLALPAPGLACSRGAVRPGVQGVVRCALRPAAQPAVAGLCRIGGPALTRGACAPQRPTPGVQLGGSGAWERAAPTWGHFVSVGRFRAQSTQG